MHFGPDGIVNVPPPAQTLQIRRFEPNLLRVSLWHRATLYHPGPRRYPPGTNVEPPECTPVPPPSPTTMTVFWVYGVLIPGVPRTARGPLLTPVS